LGVRGGNDSASGGLLGSIDSHQMVKNLCASEKYHPKDYFVTITCNQLKHFGTKILKEWIDSQEWVHMNPQFRNLTPIEKEEIQVAMAQAGSGLFLRNWQEICQLLVDYLRYSPRSPFKRVGSIFSRNEYQKDVGNLSHIHLILQVLWDLLNESELEFMEELIRADIISVVKSEEIRDLIKEGLFKVPEDVVGAVHDAFTFLCHKCSERCQEMVAPGLYRCRKPNYGHMTPDPTKNVFLSLPNTFPPACLETLQRIGLAHIPQPDQNGYQCPPIFHHKFFTPTRHIPAINLNCDKNISPIESRLFLLCRSMQNVQLIRGTGGCNKYVCKYIAKIDEQNYVIVSVDKNMNGELVTKSTFLHNTKVHRTNINETAVRDSNRESRRPQGRAISLMEMLHVMLKYPEVLTDLRFVTVPTVPLELRSRISIKADKFARDAEFSSPEICESRLSNIVGQPFRQLTDMEVLIINDLRLSQCSVDRVTQFSLRPPELRLLFDELGNYFRWFSIEESKVLKGADLEIIINDDIYHPTCGSF
jgi:hypothetical protein